MYASLGQKVVSKTYYLHTDFPMYSLKKLVVLAVAVVVVNPAGKLRVTYSGHPSTTAEPSSPCKSLPSRFPNNVIFIPYGITTNSLTCPPSTTEGSFSQSALQQTAGVGS